MLTVTWRNGLSAGTVAEVDALLDAATAADGVAPVSDQVLRRLRERSPAAEQVERVQGDLAGSEHFVARLAGGELAGYAFLDTEGDSEGRAVAELVVHPEHRGSGVGSELVRALLERMGLPVTQEGEPGDTLRVWSHSGHPAAARLAARFGFREARQLWRMWAKLAPTLPEPRWPEGVEVRSFVPGRDEEDVVEVNRLAFAWHPEQGSLSVADLRGQQEEAWFDPAGFLLAVDGEGGVLGFHWTKVHQGDQPHGEVYVLGVHPEAQGTGLGTALTLAGLRHLAGQGLDDVLLYVEGDNGAAIRVYEKLGFTHRETDVQFSR
ncbi:mycothiol synthase [Actinoalloteichus caeruleus]|uniref:mycothiol synthase n=1 Tax=Actinoalloteichus cyanogriseus TaxID=2893586 RepID=UPI003BB96B7A